MVISTLGRGIGRAARTLARPAKRSIFAPPLVEAGYRLASAAALGWGTMLGGSVRKIGELTVVTDLPNWAFGRGGTTVGSTFLTRGAVSTAILEHEDVHRQQWRRYGLAFIPMYFAAGLEGETNRFEIEADLVKGGYLPKPTKRLPRGQVRGTTH